jgi:excisionase family DNA binding protein
MDTKNTDTPSTEWMTVEELAGRLGMTKKALYARIARETIPGVLKLGRTIRIKREAVEAWVTANYRGDTV